MPTPTYTPLATVTLGGTASSVTFSSIPATYRDLIVVVTGSAGVSTNVRVRFNGDSGNNYSFVYAYGNGSITESAAQSGISSITQLGLLTSISNNLTQIMDYSATDKHKTVLIRSNAASGFVQATAARWANTAAITSMVFSPIESTTFNSGCTFNLYGIVA